MWRYLRARTQPEQEAIPLIVPAQKIADGAVAAREEIPSEEALAKLLFRAHPNEPAGPEYEKACVGTYEQQRCFAPQPGAF